MPDSTTSAPEGVLFEETQHLSGIAVGALALATVGVLAAMAAAAHARAPGRPAGVIGLGVAALALGAAAASRLMTRVTTAVAEVRFPPFPFTTIRLAPQDIAEVGPLRYGLFDSPGGVGYHIGFGSISATASTGTGILVRRPDGRRILVGTRRPEALLAALRQLQERGAR